MRLWQLLQNATQAPDDPLVMGIHEVRPSQAMEMGQIMPKLYSHGVPVVRAGPPASVLPIGQARRESARAPSARLRQSTFPTG